MDDQQARIDASGERRALDEAYRLETRAAAVDGLLDLLGPYQWHVDAPMVVEVWDGEPPAGEHADGDHVVDTPIPSCRSPRLLLGRDAVEVSDRGFAGTGVDMIHGQIGT